MAMTCGKNERIELPKVIVQCTVQDIAGRMKSPKGAEYNQIVLIGRRLREMA